jgi:hypothetical protein
MRRDRGSIDIEAALARRPRVQRPRLPVRLWHYRHVAAIGAAPGGLIWLGVATNPLEPVAVLFAAVLSVVAVPLTRRWAVARWRCIVVPHHIRSIFLRKRICAEDGRMPSILWTSPAPYGVRVRVRVPIGMRPQRMVDAQGEIRAACDADDIVVVWEPRRRKVIIGLWFAPKGMWWER